ncbi:MAG: EamA family transporter [Trichocoleus desertorum ATA4-8-CV12]|jgi:drug/metabolite transporter (DMT)-like permease|nr:EamA family transporter [Trichocoleus desertorum ATA4-8-CV12]
MTWLAISLVLTSAVIHATWNLLAHSKKADGLVFLRLSLLTGLVGLLPALFAEYKSAFPLTVWGLLILTGLFEAVYYLGLTMGYRHGNFSVVYPVARALPILFLSIVDVSRGRTPSLLGWLGILLVVIGCVLAPLQSLRNVKLTDYWNQATVWILVIMFATVGYTTVDKFAAELIPTGAETSARYIIWQSLLTIPFLGIALKCMGEPISKQKILMDWKGTTIYASFVFGSYWLMLWAYQLSPYVSYLSALRQFSIVLGVAYATVVFREPSPALRISAAILITLGMLCISQTS